MIAEHGERLDVIPMHPEDHEVIDPIEELLRMKPDANIIVISPNADAPSDIGDITPTSRGKDQ